MDEIIGNSVEGGDLHVTNKSKVDIQIVENVKEYKKNSYLKPYENGITI